jgi:hypothetical protein
MNFTDEQLKIIYQAIRYYQIHGVNFNGSDYKICSEILDMTFDKHYTQRKEQPT